MPIQLVLAVRDGWKQKDNERFGQCLEVRFIDMASEKILFRYAPTLQDENFWNDMFTKLKVYDRLHKEIFSLVMTLDGERTISCGSGNKNNPIPPLLASNTSEKNYLSCTPEKTKERIN